ncbi:multidrug ABC transporter ATP-binding protein [Tumebacillus avium]|uniref:Multidrug ABC transporter ATP-binding protein n=1 Tax=Tumebacillus avium TaxID=1903704 RepID=A0A1Y0IV43_9BACL|nr:ATP-binding cassette domain-containing protein [Tumebacillus avium]ARU63799.1 multidrug ABC transporter ATP-binding protein [Tumebacillus avium]
MTTAKSYIQIQNMSKKIQGATVLDSINLELQSGKIYGFQGKNGSGKTMLFRAICGLILPSAGEVRIDGERLGADLSFPRSVGILIEYPGFLPQYTGLKNLMLLASLKEEIGEDEVRTSIARVGLDPDDKRKFKKYSLGMKQRLGLAQTIMEDPDLVILDEPTNALDDKGVEMVRDILLDLKQRGKTVLVASHDKEELDFLVDEKFTMENGRITKHEVMKKESV